jgi:hypothetical protein
MHPQGLETLTKKVALATSHRVISPSVGSTKGPRYSIPFFQNISQHVVVAKELIDCEFLADEKSSMLIDQPSVPPDLIALRDARGSSDGSKTECECPSVT